MELLSGDLSEYATTKDVDYPLGTNKWQLVLPTSSREILLNFNACDDDFEFNCNNSICVTMDQRQ